MLLASLPIAGSSNYLSRSSHCGVLSKLNWTNPQSVIYKPRITVASLRSHEKSRMRSHTTQMSGMLKGTRMSQGTATTTDRQRRIVEAFHRRAAAGTAPPTLRELCKEFGWRSTGTARDHIRALVNKGLLSPAAKRSRGVHLTKPPAQGRTIPLVGRIAAGKPVLSSENSSSEMLVPVEFLPSGQAFIVRVSGDSMEGAGILPNDLVVAKVANSAERGAIVVVTLGDESTLKFLDHRKGRWWLVSANPKYPPFEIQSPAIVQGIATAVLRKIEPNATAIHGWLLRGTSSQGGSK